MARVSRLTVVFLLLASAHGLVPSSQSALCAIRGGAEATKLEPSRSVLGKFVSAIRNFVASFFDPAFGGSRSASPQAAATTVTKKAAPRSSRSSGSRKTVTVADLKDIEGGQVKPIRNEAEFAKAIATSKLVVVDFWASWCGPCQSMKPKYSAMSDRMSKKAHFLSVDVDKVKPVAQKYSVSSMPTFLFFKSGKELDRFSGADEDRLATLISRLA